MSGVQSPRAWLWRAAAGLLLATSSGCLGSYRVDVRERATGDPVTAVVEVAQVEAGPEERELFWTREVWLAPDRDARISLWGSVPYRMILFVRPALDTPIPDRDEWAVLARWPRPLRPGDDAGVWHVSSDGRFELRLAR